MPNFITSKVFLLPSFDFTKKEREKLDFFLHVLDQADIGKYIESNTTQTNHDQGGRPHYNPYRLFATIVYAFSKHSGSLRRIEESVQYDLRFIYLMEQQRPTYVTFSKFLNNIIVKFHREIFSSIVKVILHQYHISIDDVFVDGSKFEANVNKYKFVWKPTTFHSKLNQSSLELILRYFPNELSPNHFLTAKDIGLFLQRLALQISALGIDIDTIPHGRGHPLPSIVRDYRKVQMAMLRTLDYEE